MVLLEAGNLVPADGRLVEAASLRVQESALTGESEGVGKTTEALEGDDAVILQVVNGARRAHVHHHLVAVVTKNRSGGADPDRLVAAHAALLHKSDWGFTA